MCITYMYHITCTCSLNWVGEFLIFSYCCKHLVVGEGRCTCTCTCIIIQLKLARYIYVCTVYMYNVHAVYYTYRVIRPSLLHLCNGPRDDASGLVATGWPTHGVCLASPSLPIGQHSATEPWHEVGDKVTSTRVIHCLLGGIVEHLHVHVHVHVSEGRKRKREGEWKKI